MEKIKKSNCKPVYEFTIHIGVIRPNKKIHNKLHNILGDAIEKLMSKRDNVTDYGISGRITYYDHKGKQYNNKGKQINLTEGKN